MLSRCPLTVSTRTLTDAGTASRSRVSITNHAKRLSFSGLGYSSPKYQSILRDYNWIGGFWGVNLAAVPSSVGIGTIRDVVRILFLLEGRRISKRYDCIVTKRDIESGFGGT